MASSLSTTPAELATRSGKATIGSGPLCTRSSAARQDRLPNYAYSSAMKDADTVWDKATLDRFIANPDQVVPGHKMKPYGGIASVEDRAKIIAFLEASGSN